MPCRFLTSRPPCAPFLPGRAIQALAVRSFERAGAAVMQASCWKGSRGEGMLSHPGAVPVAPPTPPAPGGPSAMNGQQWYVAVAGQQQGPFSTADVVARVRAGQLDRSAHVFTQGMTNWETIASRPEFADAFNAPAAAAAPAYGAAPAAARPAAPVAHEIDYEIFGQEMQFVEITLDPGEACVAEAGSFMYMDPGIQMETIFGDGSAQGSGGGFMGKLMQAGKRVLTGESLFMTVFGNTGVVRQKVAFASPYPGSIVPLDLRKLGGTMLCQKDAFLCAAKGISVGIAFQRKLGVGLFGGEGFILEKLEGDGLAFVHAGGCVVERELR